MSVKPIPDGYHSITPYLIIKGAAQAMDFYAKAFGAKQLLRMDGPNGTLGHGEMVIGNSPFMLSDEHPDYGARGPLHYGGSPVSLMIYVEDVDAVYNQAVAAGATALRPVQNQFYGDRSGTVKDPFGHTWTISTHIEDVPPEELERRMTEMMSQPKEG